MRQIIFYLSISSLILVFVFANYAQNKSDQDLKARKFFVESQPDSPVLIRDFSATLSPSRFGTLLEIEVVFYFENISEKKIKSYTYQSPEADGLGSKDFTGGWGGNLLPGESERHNTGYSVEGKAKIYRIDKVEFEDGTIWKAKPFDAAKAKKSAPITATAKKSNKNPKPKRNLTREWFKPVFSDQVTKTINATPQVFNNIQIKTKLLELKPEIYDEIEFCPSSIQEVEEYNPDIIPIDFDYIIRKATTYEINGRVFAHVVPFEGIEAETQFEIGVGFQNVYVDEDGNGYFKLRCDETELKSLPQWVKDLSGKLNIKR